MAQGGFRSLLPFRSPALLAGGTIVPVQTGAATPVSGRDLVSLLNIQSEAQRLRAGFNGQTIYQALSAIQSHASTTDQRLRHVSQQQNNSGLTKDPAGNIFFQGATFAVRAGNQNFVLANGRMSYGVANTAPVDADIPNGHMTAYVDEVGDILIFRVRYSNGVLKTGTVPLV